MRVPYPSVGTSAWEHYCPKARGKLSILPVAFGCRRSSGGCWVRCVGGGGDGVSGSPTGVVSDVSGRGSVTGRACCSTGRIVLTVTCGAMRGKSRLAGLACLELATNPGTGGLNSPPGSVVGRADLFEMADHMLGAFRRPQHHGPVVRRVTPHGSGSL
jgi:hypothetical protein